jgi:hypothetical protein
VGIKVTALWVTPSNHSQQLLNWDQDYIDAIVSKILSFGKFYNYSYGDFFSSLLGGHLSTRIGGFWQFAVWLWQPVCGSVGIEP